MGVTPRLVSQGFQVQHRAAVEPKRRERLTHLHIYEDAFVPGDSQCALWIGLRFLSGHSADLPVYDWLPHRCEFWMVWTIREDRGRSAPNSLTHDPEPQKRTG